MITAGINATKTSAGTMPVGTMSSGGGQARRLGIPATPARLISTAVRRSKPEVATSTVMQTAASADVPGQRNSARSRHGSRAGTIRVGAGPWSSTTGSGRGESRLSPGASGARTNGATSNSSRPKAESAQAKIAAPGALPPTKPARGNAVALAEPVRRPASDDHRGVERRRAGAARQPDRAQPGHGRDAVTGQPQQCQAGR
ncbi:hypothetical protein ACFQS7_11735 [Dankookia sp. GCM10030260]|uniref:hypothetical protein n=1 Tax=Dankookia sp. GCM10030260 TaxID=3273390 RepID=UPI0036145D25